MLMSVPSDSVHDTEPVGFGSPEMSMLPSDVSASGWSQPRRVASAIASAGLCGSVTGVVVVVALVATVFGGTYRFPFRAASFAVSDGPLLPPLHAARPSAMTMVTAAGLIAVEYGRSVAAGGDTCRRTSSAT